ncbi:MAG: hypothetical protein ACTTIC_00725 [Helicobacteraceae bacterium]
MLRLADISTTKEGITARRPFEIFKVQKEITKHAELLCLINPDLAKHLDLNLGFIPPPRFRAPANTRAPLATTAAQTASVVLLAILEAPWEFLKDENTLNNYWRYAR